jgi:hypothetical protein
MNSYFLTNRSKYYYFAFSMIPLIAIMGLFLYFTRNFVCVQFYFLGCALYAIYVLLKKLRTEHVAISEKGVEYSAPGINFEVHWSDVEKLSKHWRFGFQHECLLVGNSKVRVKKWWGGNFGIPTPMNFWTDKTIVPLSCFSENWRDSELGRQIKQYAPHLFEKEKSVQSA